MPRIVPGWCEGEHFLLIPHEGKSDLDKSIPIKLKAWRYPGDRFVVVRDNDGADCLAVKARLRMLCQSGGREAIIRLICQELEGWYLADPAALQAAYPESRKAVDKLVRRFPEPDACIKPSRELEREIPQFQKRDGARRLGRLLEPDRSMSASHRVFVDTVVRLSQEV